MNDMLVYQLLEIDYIKMHGRKISSDPYENKDLFPHGWFYKLKFDEKIEILNEAIEKKILIIDTDVYEKYVEGIKINKKNI